MGQQPGATKEVNRFLEDVAEQIQYKPIRKEIKEELEAHIEDRKEEYTLQGMDEADAWNKAIDHMGDAVEIGVHLNEVRKVQKNPLTVILVIALMVIGLLGNIRAGMVEKSGIFFLDSSYFLYGFTIFLIMYYFGFESMVKHLRTKFKVFMGAWLFILVFFMIQRVFEIHIYRMTKITIIFAGELLSIPIIIGMAYFNRNKKYKSILLTAAVAAIVITSISVHFMDDYFLVSNLIFLLTIFTALFYMIMKGMIKGKIRNQLFSWLLSLGVVLAIFAVSFEGSWKYEFQQCFYPEKIASDYFDDSYNSILIKNLLGKAELAGAIKLSQEELKSYYTSEWYFKNLDEFDYEYKMQSVKDGEVKALEDVLPEHYQSNYRIAYWIFKYGWLPSIVLILMAAAVYGMLIRMVGRMKNNIGKVLAFSCTVALLLQFILYVLGNFGFQFGRFCNFPFISEGSASIIVNAVLVGLACSAFRYDRVFKEENRKGVII